MTYTKNTNRLEDSVADHSATQLQSHCDICPTCNYSLIGKLKLYLWVRSAPRPRRLRSTLEHGPGHYPEESMNNPGTIDPLLSSSQSNDPYLTSSSAFLPSSSSYTPLSSLSQPDQFSSTPSLPAPLSAQSDSSLSSSVWGPTSLASSSSSLTSSNAAVASGGSQATLSMKDNHLWIIVGSVLGGLVVLLGVGVCCYLFRKTRRKRKRKIGYNNLPSEDERPYLRGTESDDNWVIYTHSERESQDVDEQGRFTSLQRNGRDVQHSYSLTNITPDDRRHCMTFSSRGGEDSPSVPARGPNGSSTIRSDVERLISQQDRDSWANDFGEGFRTKISSGVGAHTSSSASIASWAREALGFTTPNISTRYGASRTTVDINQISWPRQLQKWKRPTQPKRGAG